MGRSTEQSYKTIVDYLKQRKLPATINDMVGANICSRATLFRLLQPEMFSSAAVFGIQPLNDSKPYFFAYNENLQLEVLGSANAKAGELIEQHRDVLVGAANRVAANAIVPDNLERKVLSCVQKHRAAEDMKEKDATLLDNFTRISGPEHFLHQVDIPEVREIFLSDISKFRTFLISAYVASFNEE